MNIKETAQAIHAINKEKGFWDKPRNTGELLMLIKSELCEALEADRKKNYANIYWLKQFENKGVTHATKEEIRICKEVFERDMKDTFEDEIADAVIRLFDLSEGMGIDLEFHIRHKMEYNKTRERLHGKAY